jgi:hypothetical protein
MATHRSGDPLLGVTQFLLNLIIVVMAVVLLAGLVAVPALLLLPAEQLGPEIGARGTAGWVAAGAAMLVVLCTLGIAFIRALTRIIGSVGDGDPFRPDNADRLSQMGWIALAVQVCALIFVPISQTIAERVGGGAGIDPAFDSLILALVLFILARVFRRGTQMRDDLEGTV